MAKTPEKSEGAFRTIREVADWLAVPTHVLRFWESKFEQVQPVKGAGGRRYYRPEDMRLLGGIKVLLHDQGQTIRGVAQRIEDEGAAPVMALAPALDAPDAAPQPDRRARKVIRGGAKVVPFDRASPEHAAPDPAPAPGDAEAGPGDAEAAPGDGEGAGGDLPAADLPDPAPEDPASAPQPVPEVAEGVEDAPPAPVPDDLPAPPEAPPQPAPEPEPGTALPEETPDDAAAAAPPPALEAPPEAAVPVPPTLAALRLVRAARGCREPRRLRRVARRLRGLADEVAADLGVDAGA